MWRSDVAFVVMVAAAACTSKAVRPPPGIVREMRLQCPLNSHPDDSAEATKDCGGSAEVVVKDPSGKISGVCKTIDRWAFKCIPDCMFGAKETTADKVVCMEAPGPCPSCQVRDAHGFCVPPPACAACETRDASTCECVKKTCTACQRLNADCSCGVKHRVVNCKAWHECDAAHWNNPAGCAGEAHQAQFEQCWLDTVLKC